MCRSRAPPVEAFRAAKGAVKTYDAQDSSGSINIRELVRIEQSRAEFSERLLQRCTLGFSRIMQKSHSSESFRLSDRPVECQQPRARNDLVPVVAMLA